MQPRQGPAKKRARRGAGLSRGNRVLTGGAASLRDRYVDLLAYDEEVPGILGVEPPFAVDGERRVRGAKGELQEEPGPN